MLFNLVHLDTEGPCERADQTGVAQQHDLSADGRLRQSQGYRGVAARRWTMRYQEAKESASRPVHQDVLYHGGPTND